jgi:hypothetical protein
VKPESFKEWQARMLDSMRADDLVLCQRCGGDGENSDNTRCLKCNGAGQLRWRAIAAGERRSYLSVRHWHQSVCDAAVKLERWNGTPAARTLFLLGMAPACSVVAKHVYIPAQ